MNNKGSSNFKVKHKLQTILAYIAIIVVNIVINVFLFQDRDTTYDNKEIKFEKYIKTNENEKLEKDKQYVVFLAKGFIEKSTKIELPEAYGLDKRNKEILLENIIRYISARYPNAIILQSNNHYLLIDLGVTKGEVVPIWWEKVKMVIYLTGEKDNYRLHLVTVAEVASGNPYQPPPDKEFIYLKNDYAHYQSEYTGRFLSTLAKALSDPKLYNGDKETAR